MWILDELKKYKNINTLAVIERDNRYSFSDLWKHSNQIAREITELTNTNKRRHL